METLHSLNKTIAITALIAALFAFGEYFYSSEKPKQEKLSQQQASSIDKSQKSPKEQAL